MFIQWKFAQCCPFLSEDSHFIAHLKLCPLTFYFILQVHKQVDYSALCLILQVRQLTVVSMEGGHLRARPPIPSMATQPPRPPPPIANPVSTPLPLPPKALQEMQQISNILNAQVSITGETY